MRRTFRIAASSWYAAIVTLGLAVAGPASAMPEAPSVEYQVKAAYLSKLGNFVQWPADSEALAQDQATICILGNDPFGQFIDGVVVGHKIGERTIAIRRLAKVTKGISEGCQILYIGETDPKRAQGMLDALQGQHVLTVADAAARGDISPVVSFVLHNNNVRFEIDQGAAADNGLTISSQLLALAVAVRPAKPGEPR